ncbi:MAG: hypothetical protein HDT47_08360 [Ruminococcaceae bacterium]|nr:hypothetical protein [Oscillospiraceae bacterium]
MLKKTYLTITAALTCLSLSVGAFANAAAEEDEPFVSGAQQPVITAAPPFDPTVPSTDTELAVEPDVDPVEIIEPIVAPVPNETAPADSSDLLNNYYTGTGDIENIYEYWETNGYPEDVSFVANNSIAEYHVATQTEVIHYFWTIGTVNADEARKQEICALISSGHRVSFEDCEYSHEYRVQVKEEIERDYPQAAAELENSQRILIYLDNYPEEERDGIENDICQRYNTGISELVFVLKTTPTVGIPETAIEIAIAPEIEIDDGIGVDVVVTADIGVDATAVESNIDIPSNVNVPSDATIPQTSKNAENQGSGNVIPEIGINDIGIDDAAAANIADASQKAEYVVEEEEEIGEVAAIISETGKKESGGFWVWICSAAAAVIAIAAAVFIGRGKQADSLSLADGGEVSVGGKVSRAEIVKAVGKSVTEPSDSAFNEIMEKIKGEEK